MHLGLQPVLVALEQLPLLERLLEPSKVAMHIRKQVLRSHRLDLHIRNRYHSRYRNRNRCCRS